MKVGLPMMNGQSKPIRAVAYARTSKVLGQNPDLQVQAIREFARARGFDLVGEHVDQVTGDRERRKGLDALVADCKLGKANVVIITALDRMFRSTKGMLNLLDELNHYGVSIISIREQLDFSTPAGRMALTVLSACATLEKSIISDRIRTTLAIKKLTAGHTGWRCGRPSAVTPELEREIRALRGRGMTLREIEAALNKRVSYSVVSRLLKESASRCDTPRTEAQLSAAIPHSQTQGLCVVEPIGLATTLRASRE